MKKYTYKKRYNKNNSQSKLKKMRNNGYAFAKRYAPQKKKAPVFDYSKYFEFDNRGRIKGSYVNGVFEPD